MQDGEHRPGVAAGAVSGFMLTAQAAGSTRGSSDRAKVGAGGTAIAEGTKPVRGFLRSGVVQYVTR